MAVFRAVQVEKYNNMFTIEGYGEFSVDMGWRFEVYQDDVYYRDLYISAKKLTSPGGAKTQQEVIDELQALLAGEALHNGDDAPVVLPDIPEQQFDEGV